MLLFSQAPKTQNDKVQKMNSPYEQLRALLYSRYDDLERSVSRTEQEIGDGALEMTDILRLRLDTSRLELDLLVDLITLYDARPTLVPVREDR